MKKSNQLPTEFTDGEKLVGLNALPTGIKGTDEYMYDVKLAFSKIVDMLLRKRQNKDNSYSLNLLIGAALNITISACSMVIKVITWKD